MGRKIGRPISADNIKKRSVSISLTPYHLQVLGHLCDKNEVSRSKMIGVLVETAGYLELGANGMVQPHMGTPSPLRTRKAYANGQYGKWVLNPKILVCNPHSVKGLCQNSACQAIYKKEGLI